MAATSIRHSRFDQAARRTLDLVFRSLPSESATRGFALTANSAHLDACAEAFMRGARRYLATAPDNPHTDLNTEHAELRGFALEGAAMAASLLDLGVPGRGRIRNLLTGSGHKYRYLIHVGVGWGMARLGRRIPREAWGLDPLLRWLALDGMGFSRLFFSPTRKHRAFVTPITHSTHYVLAQGMGRALWFTCGADVDNIAQVIDRAPLQNRGALWSGIGLASAYAGAPTLNVERILAAGREQSAALRQGVRFGLAARAATGEETGSEWCSVVGSEQICLGLAEHTAQHHRTPGAPLAAYRCWQSDLETSEVSK